MVHLSCTVVCTCLFHLSSHFRYLALFLLLLVVPPSVLIYFVSKWLLFLHTHIPRPILVCSNYLVIFNAALTYFLHVVIVIFPLRLTFDIPPLTFGFSDMSYANRWLWLLAATALGQDGKLMVQMSLFLVYMLCMCASYLVLLHHTFVIPLWPSSLFLHAPRSGTKANILGVAFTGVRSGKRSKTGSHNSDKSSSSVSSGGSGMCLSFFMLYMNR